MARTTPQVANNLLTDHGGAEPLLVGSPAWYAWLDEAHLFAFRDAAGSFTARRESRARGGAYWRAYRTVDGRQLRAYLGRSSDLTPAQLHKVAGQLAAQAAEQYQGSRPAPEPVAVASAAPPSSAATPLLSTKLFLPRPRQARVPRPRLLERLAAGLRGPLTLIAAPAGFGKTTLLAELLAHQRLETGDWRLGQTSLTSSFEPRASRAAWLSLDAGDNDPAVFLRYLIAALRQARTSTFGAMALLLLDAPQPAPLPIMLTSIVNELAGAPEPVLLVLDDYHVIDSPAVHDAIMFVLEHQPESLRLVIASREDPPLPLARLRARGQLTELRAADLRFTPAETVAFLHDVMALGLNKEQVAALELRTEGWVAGLQLAALALQSHADRDAFVAAFTGSNRFVVDYLASEVLDRLPDDLRAFVVQTSILKRLCAPLCDSVLGVGGWELGGGMHGSAPNPYPLSPIPQSHSQNILDQLERANLFLIPLDDERRWYRYHQLFADVLRERLARSLDATRVAELHRRASGWFEQHDLLAEAIEHALAAADFERAAGLIERIALPMELEGQHATLRTWLHQLPSDMASKRPLLALAHAAIASLNTDFSRVEEYLQLAEQGASDWAPKQAEALQTEIAALRAVTSSMQGDIRALEFGRLALARLPAPHSFRSITVAGLGYAYFYIGDLAAADQILLQDLATQRLERSQMVIHTALDALLAMVRRAQGRLRDMQRMAERVLVQSRHDGRMMPLSGAFLAYLLIGLTQCERDDLDAAERTLSECATLAAQYQVTMYEILAQFYLGHVRSARGDVAGALDLVERASAAAPRYLSPLNMCELVGYRVMLWLKSGQLERAAAWATQFQAAGAAPRPRFTAYDYDRFACARVLMVQEHWDLASAAVGQLLNDAEATGHGRFVIWALVLQALIAQAQGDTTAALVPLTRALALAEPEGFVRVFVDEGAPMASLLHEAQARGGMRQYVAKLLAAFGALEAGDGRRVDSTPAASLQPPAASLAEPLSARELEVLRLLAAGHNNDEIARALVVAVSTVKSHINHIFGKLGAANRLEAVLRAQQLKLI